MPITKSWAGSSFNLPLNREPKSANWGTEVSNFLIAIADQAIPKTGGLNTLTAELNFGAVYGVVLPILKSASASISTTGVIRLANNEGIGWRNANSSADLILKANASNRLEFDNVAVPTISSTDSLTNKTLTDASNHISASILDSGTIPDARIQATGVTQHVSSLAHQSLSGKGTNDHSQIDTAISNSVSHIANLSNPHSVSKTQVGLGNCDDTSDANKPVSTAQATAIGLKADTSALSSHTGNTSNPHTVTHSQLSDKGTNAHSVIDSHLSSTANPHSVTQAQVIGDNAVTLKEIATPANPASTYYKIYPKSDGKIYRLNSAGSEVMVGGGGGLVATPTDHTATTLAVGRHYLIDMSGASADVTVTLPAGAAESVVKVSATGNATNGWRVIVDGNASEKIAYDSVQYDSAKIIYADQWAEFSWDSNDSQWIVNDASSPLSGTFSGALTVTGPLTPSGGIVGKTDGVAVAAGYVGQMIGTLRSGTNGYTYSTTSTTAVTNSLASVISITLNKGVYLVSATVNCLSATGATYLGARVHVGGTAVMDTKYSAVNTTNVFGQVPITLPIVISADSTVVDVYALVGGGTTASNTHEMWAIRIA